MSHSVIWNNKSYANAGSGVMLDRNCYGNLVANNEVYGNNQGIAVYESSDNRLIGNVVVGNNKSAVRIRNSTDITVQDNVLVGHGDYAFEISARRLDDHEKRQARGDLYTQELTAKLYANRLGANYGFIKANGLKCSGDLVEELSNKVHETLDAAMARCQGNKRATLRPVDL